LCIFSAPLRKHLLQNMINESKPQIFEKKEKEAWKHIKVFRVRHGNTPYHEQLEGIPGDKIDLTEKGIKEIKSAAEKIALRNVEATVAPKVKELIVVVPADKFKVGALV